MKQQKTKNKLNCECETNNTIGGLPIVKWILDENTGVDMIVLTDKPMCGVKGISFSDKGKEDATL